jgi:methyl-accepting chemotaxis protein
MEELSYGYERRKMAQLKLGTKFTLILSAVFIVGIVATAVLLYPVLTQHAQGEISQRGLILIETMNSVRDYTSRHISPLLATNAANSSEFIREIVPAFSARTVFDDFRANDAYQNFFYKEATENPMNLNDRVDPFEMTLIEQFRRDNQLHELSGFTTREGEYVFYSARPLSVSSESCLACHASPETAPASLVSAYGTEHGYGWALNEIVTAQTVYVPASQVFDYANQGVAVVMGVIVLIFAVVVFAIHFLLNRAVVQPAKQIGALAALIDADKLSPQSPELAAVGVVACRDDELGATAKVFEKMARDVYQREQQLKHEVQELLVHIDRTSEMAQVKEVTESDYFKHLQDQVKQMRHHNEPNAGA